jgi:hypothetical protein
MPANSGNDSALNLDQFGNPAGDGLGLECDKPGTILIYCASRSWAKQIFPEDTPAWVALRANEFKLEFAQGNFPREKLEEVDQLWLFSSQKHDARRVSAQDYAAIVEFAQRRKGLYLLADNDGFTHESNELVGRMFGSYVRGDYKGQKLLAVSRPNVTPELQSRYGAEYEVPDHVLLKDISFLYEGISISHIGPSSDLETAITASDGQALVAVATKSHMSVVIDCGFTRYMRDHRDKAAGSTRFAQNVASYLMGRR